MEEGLHHRPVKEAHRILPVLLQSLNPMITSSNHNPWDTGEEGTLVGEEGTLEGRRGVEGKEGHYTLEGRS